MTGAQAEAVAAWYQSFFLPRQVLRNANVNSCPDGSSLIQIVYLYC